MDCFQLARLYFNNYPEEIFTLWLDDRIKHKGWPPNGIEWEGFLFGRTPKYWKDIRWRKQKVKLRPNILGSRSQDLVEAVIETNVYGMRNSLSDYLPETKAKFSRIVKYVLTNHELPSTLVLLKVGDVFEIVDGCHRVSVLLSLRYILKEDNLISEDAEAWVGCYEKA